MMFGFSLDKWLVGIAILLAAFLATYYTGYWRGWNASEEVWKLRASEMTSKAKLEAAALRSEGQRLAAELVEARAKVRVETIEVIREVKRYARPHHSAIDGRITDLLNSLSGIRERTERTVHGADGAVETHTSVTTHPGRPTPGSTSEKAIVEWVGTVVPMYEACRRQAHATAELLKQCAAGKPASQ